jgi:type II secretory pathway pseudopilin PulG
MTLYELMIGVAIASLLALLIGALGTRVLTLNRENRTGMQNQQDMAFALRQFSEDVRKAIGIAKEPSGSEFVLKQPHEGSYRYVTYRFAAQKLQRGLSATANAQPSAWSDVVDSASFHVQRGGFRYFTVEGAPTATREAMRRIDVTELRVRSAEGAEIRDIPTISATMREASQIRALEVADETIRLSNGSTKNPKLTLNLRNASESPVAFSHVSLAWSPTAPENKGKGTTMDIGGLTKQSLGKLDGVVVLQPGETVAMAFAFQYVDRMTLPATLTMTLRAPSESGPGRPYVVIVDVFPKHER